MVFNEVVMEARMAVERREDRKKAGSQLSYAPSADPKSTSCSLSLNPRPSLNCPDMQG